MENSTADNMARPEGKEARECFQTTHWTVVLDSVRPGSPLGQEAFARLYSDYWPPLYGYVRRRGFAPEEAEDITQDFFTAILTKQPFAALQREGGRFRSFLLGALVNFLANEWDRRRAQKRGGGQRPLSLNVENGEACFALDASTGETPESQFEKRWALTLLEQVTGALRDEYAAADKRELFEQLRGCLQGDRSGPSYATIAARCGITEGVVKVTVHRMRQRFGHLLRAAIARTVSTEQEVDAELRYLISVVAR
jgi:RNA polymerase sigma factor (sigma-70 family)